ncbi:MAG: 30S ribosomal protein S12 methylthiotransferase RimO [Bacteroidetes bacterium]|nr:30S ribosomal protein S12 methylthiotransferase RimO [Bacteroidota bacterium]
MKIKTAPRKIGIVSLGCAKNLVDSEVLMHQLKEDNFNLIMNPEDTEDMDAVIINTCGFILDAKQESIDTILRFAKAKEQHQLREIYVMGCLSQRYESQLRMEIPEVNEFYGVNDLEKIIQRIGGKFRNTLLGEREISTPKHYAYLKIAEGCDRKCSFCAIPLIRGRHVSTPMKDIIKEATFLVNKGVKELNIISQDTTYYGMDLYHQRRLPELLESLSAISDLEWIRLNYLYPHDFPMELLDVINRNTNICKYIDLPLQHINSRILKSMRRGIGTEGTKKLIRSIRNKIPDIAIRTTFIVGYPGETVAEFEELVAFIQLEKFDRVGAFLYSHEEDTLAFRLKDNIPYTIKKHRMDEIMKLQEEISYQQNFQKIGKIYKVLIDREDEDYFVGRTEFDAPEVDNEVLISKTSLPVLTGKFYSVKITGALEFDLIGEIQSD